MYLYLCCCQRAVAEIAESWKASMQAVSQGRTPISVEKITFTLLIKVPVNE